MKFSFLIALDLLWNNKVPLVPRDNSHYVEGESRYIWIPDGDGVPHLVDLEEPVDQAALGRRNGDKNEYWLFTRRNPIKAQIIVNENVKSIIKSNYMSTRPLMVVVHGWYSNGHAVLNPLITSEYLQVADANVIVVDWHNVAIASYTTAVNGTSSVGQFLGNFLEWLLNNGGGNWGDVHLVGFSLGAHVVGVAGRTTNGQIGRITGLDPAAPLWDNNSDALNYKDAEYVEIIHTDGGSLGIFKPIGDTDFYANGGGHPQPGCWIDICSHKRSYELFAATIRHDHLVGKRCENIDEVRRKTCKGDILGMGNSDSSKRGEPGLYGLTTADIWPF